MLHANLLPVSKRCSQCKRLKAQSDFSFHSQETGRRYSACKTCTKAKRTKQYSQNREALQEAQRTIRAKNPLKWKRYQRNLDLLRFYGITEEKFQEMSATQGHCCALCRRHKDQIGGKGLVVDHNHKTGAIRALLCTRCNSGIGTFNEDPELLLKVSEYVRLGGVK